MNHYFVALPRDPLLISALLRHHSGIAPATMSCPTVDMVGMSGSLFIGIPKKYIVLRQQKKDASSCQKLHKKFFLKLAFVRIMIDYL